MSTQKKSPQKRLASIAILGMGRSGQAVLDKAIALDMTVVCFDDQKITNLRLIWLWHLKIGLGRLWMR